ncbi:HNH endonuclease [bacterium]|nr:HNH endonuclease [bacterium]
MGTAVQGFHDEGGNKPPPLSPDQQRKLTQALKIFGQWLQQNAGRPDKFMTGEAFAPIIDRFLDSIGFNENDKQALGFALAAYALSPEGQYTLAASQNMPAWISGTYKQSESFGQFMGEVGPNEIGAISLGPKGVLVNNRPPINSKFAGDKIPLKGEIAARYPESVQIDPRGFPDFSPYSIKTVQIQMTGNRATDFARANKAAGFSETPQGYTWHHVEDTMTMQLVPTDLHAAVKHTGGVAVLK